MSPTGLSLGKVYFPLPLQYPLGLSISSKILSWWWKNKRLAETNPDCSVELYCGISKNVARSSGYVCICSSLTQLKPAFKHSISVLVLSSEHLAGKSDNLFVNPLLKYLTCDISDFPNLLYAFPSQ